LREYIEGRFGLRAPELTTEEFLIELVQKKPRRDPRIDHRPPAPGSAAAGQSIPREHQQLLRDFLERADLVKFAKYTPGREEIEGSFEASKRFIEGTIAAANVATATVPKSVGKGIVLKKPAAQPAMMSPTATDKNQTPIIKPTIRTGASLVTTLKPTGLMESSPISTTK